MVHVQRWLDWYDHVTVDCGELWPGIELSRFVSSITLTHPAIFLIKEKLMIVAHNQPRQSRGSIQATVATDSRDYTTDDRIRPGDEVTVSLNESKICWGQEATSSCSSLVRVFKLGFWEWFLGLASW